MRSADFAAAIGSPVLTIHLYAPLSPEEFRSRAAARRRRDPAVPALLRADLPRPRRHAADRERPARPAHARRRRLPLPDRRPLARPAPLARARPGAALHVRHVARGALPQLRHRVRLALRGRLRRGARARDLRRGARRRRSRWRTSRTRTGCSAKACRSASGELDLDPVVRRLGELCKFVVAEINEPDPARSPDMKAALPLLERVAQRARHRSAAPAAAPAAAGEPRLGHGARAPRPGSRAARAAGALRRTPRPDHRRRRVDRAPAHHLPRRLPARADHARGRPRGRAHRRPPRPRGVELAHMRYVLGDVRDTGRIERLARRGAARRDLPPGRVQARGLGRALSRRVRGHEPPGQLERPARRRPRRGGHGDRRLHGQGRAGHELLRADEAPDGAAHRVLGARGRRAPRGGAPRERARAAPAACPSSSSARRAPDSR